MNTLTQTETRSSDQADPRPRFAIGHLAMTAADVTALTEFYGDLGMRVVVSSPDFAILELRGGTHLILQPGKPGTGSLDLIVDDIDDTHAVLAAAGAEPSSIERGFPHDRFVATDLEGNTLVVASNHAIGVV